MSVINKMLRDLDTRQADNQERAGLPPKVRPLPPTPLSRTQNLRMLGVGIGVGVVIAVTVVSMLMKPEAASPPLTAPIPAPPAPVPQPPTTAVPPEPTAVQPPIDLGDMKISTLLSLPQVAAEASTEAPRPVAPPSPANPAPAGKPVAAAKPPATMPASTAPVEAQIDKRSKDGQARDMAENEYRKGMQAVKRGESAAALPSLHRALELDPMHAKARQALLSILVGGRQWAEAQRTVQAGLALDPAQTGWASILARLQFEQSDTAGALETLERHAAYAGNDADYQGLFAYMLQKQQRFAEAAQRFQAALSLRPQEGRWWFGFGLALENTGRSGESRDAYAKAKEAGNLPADMAGMVEQKLK